MVHIKKIIEIYFDYIEVLDNTQEALILTKKSLNLEIIDNIYKDKKFWVEIFQKIGSIQTLNFNKMNKLLNPNFCVLQSNFEKCLNELVYKKKNIEELKIKNKFLNFQLKKSSISLIKKSHDILKHLSKKPERLNKIKSEAQTLVKLKLIIAKKTLEEFQSVQKSNSKI